jgi:hypothetical protein
MIGTLLEVDGRMVYRLAGKDLFVPDDLAREERFLRSEQPHAPTCPRHGQPMTMESAYAPSFNERREPTQRTHWRCRTPGCHFVQATELGGG